ncbi:MAG: T9SS type A sorting domain-containing protein [Candidatus Marinimicrobia bacterium]|nr:T9SS type A sorting domain-containing protein [Candidatus Neomarinimicrobiota bacterium]
MTRQLFRFSLLLLAVQLIAQYSHEFIPVARSSQYGKSEHVFYGADSILYVAKSQAGLRAYTITDSTIDRIASIDDGQIDAIAQDVTVMQDGTILLANGIDGLRAYRWTGDLLENIAHIPTQYSASGVAVGPDSTVYLAVDNDSLYAYEFNGLEFNLKLSTPIYGRSLKLSTAYDSLLFVSGEDAGLNAYSIDDSSFTFIDYAQSTGNVHQFHLADNGIIYTANHNNGIDAFSFQDSVFHLLDNIRTNGEALDVTTLSSGRIIVANTTNLKVYSWEDSSFVFQSESESAYNAQDLALTNDGHIIAACGFNGLRKYSLEDDILVEVLQSFDGEQCIAQAAALGSGGMVFTAETRAGIGVYHFDGDTLEYISQFDNNRGMVMDLTVLSESIVIAGNRSGGIDALQFDGDNLMEMDNVDDGGFANWVTHDPNNDVIFLSTINEGIWAYELQGTQLVNQAVFDGPGGSGINNIEVIGPDTLLIAQDYYGVTLLTFSGDDFEIIAQFDTIGAVVDVARAPDGTIYAANHDAGLWAFNFNNDSLEYLADTLAEGNMERVEVLPNGTIVTVIRDVGIRAYSFDGAEFTILAQIDRYDFAGGITIDSNGLLYNAASFEGLIIYDLLPIHPISVTNPKIEPQNLLIRNYPNPFNPTTTISFDLPELCAVTLTIYDVRGREITILQNEVKPPGFYEVLWSGLDQSGTLVGTGVYFCQLKAGSYSKTIKMVYLR